jgi:starvation-inducible outer membrane lipoprotein
MSAKRILTVCLALVLCGCVTPAKIKQAQQDQARYDQEAKEKSAYDQCTAESLPGTLQHFACRLSAEQSAAPAK